MAFVSDLHILHDEVLLHFDCFVHKFVFEVYHDDAWTVVGLIVRAVSLLEESFLSLQAAQLAKLFFVQHRRKDEGYDLGLTMSPICLSENDQAVLSRLSVQQEPTGVRRLLGPDYFCIVERYL